MKRAFLTILILVSLFLTGNAVHAWYLEIDGTPGHYLNIDGGTNVLLIDGIDNASLTGAPPRGRSLNRMGTGLKL